MKHLIILMLCGIFLFFAACETRVNIETEKAEIKSVIDQFFNLYITKDIDILSSLMAHDEDMVNFGTDKVEHWVGWESLKETYMKQWQAFENPEITMKDQVVKISRSGTVAWYSMFLDFKVTFRGETVQWEGARTTGVLEKRDGRWVIVQFHNSMPVLKRAAEY